MALSVSDVRKKFTKKINILVTTLFGISQAQSLSCFQQFRQTGQGLENYDAFRIDPKLRFKKIFEGF